MTAAYQTIRVIRNTLCNMSVVTKYFVQEERRVDEIEFFILSFYGRDGLVVIGHIVSFVQPTNY